MKVTISTKKRNHSAFIGKYRIVRKLAIESLHFSVWEELDAPGCKMSACPERPPKCFIPLKQPLLRKFCSIAIGGASVSTNMQGRKRMLGVFHQVHWYFTASLQRTAKPWLHPVFAQNTEDKIISAAVEEKRTGQPGRPGSSETRMNWAVVHRLRVSYWILRSSYCFADQILCSRASGEAP